MVTSKEKREKIRFRFASDDGLHLQRGGKFQCNLCDHYFVVPGIDVTLYWFTICPSCILSGPAAVVAEAKRFAEDKDRIKRIWEITDSGTGPQDATDLAGQYRGLALRLRGIGSFEEIPGGAVAVAIAGVATKDRPQRMTRTKISEFVKSDTL